MDENDLVERLNLLSNRVIGAAIRVHDELGPGLLESAYEACLSFELLDQGLCVERRSRCRSSIGASDWNAGIEST